MQSRQSSRILPLRQHRKDRLRGCRRVEGLPDRATYHDVIGPVCDGLIRERYAFLIARHLPTVLSVEVMQRG